MKKICYYPELVDVTESITAALMMSQLEFWFKAKEGRSFYKFLEPCEHELYKKGDSWQEELGMTGSEIRSAFKKIGTPYKSKRAFTETDDIFKGKLYASYYDRIRKVTYYFRNTAKVKEVFKKLKEKTDEKECLECTQSIRTNEKIDSQRGGIQESEETLVREDSQTVYVDYVKDMGEVLEPQIVSTQKLRVESSRNEKWQDGLCIKDNNQDFIYDKQLKRQEESLKCMENHIPYLEILKLHNETLGAYLGIKDNLSLSEKESIKHLWIRLDKGLEDFELCFRKVAESSFLCGRLEGKYFRASLTWILKVEHFKRILAGGYDDFASVRYIGNRGGSMQRGVAFNKMANHDDWDFDEIERLERTYIDQMLAENERQKALKEMVQSQRQEPMENREKFEGAFYKELSVGSVEENV